MNSVAPNIASFFSFSFFFLLVASEIELRDLCFLDKQRVSYAFTMDGDPLPPPSE
jgi:hypothetical protein